MNLMTKPPARIKLRDLPMSAIVGVVDLFDYTKSRINGVRILADDKSGWGQNGDWHWHLRNARSIKPVIGHKR